MTIIADRPAVTGVPVPKLGARHQWAGGVTLGNKADNPFYRIRRLEGLGAQGERRDVRDPKAAGTGETPRRSPRAGKTVVYTGTIEADDYVALLKAEAVLQGAFADTSEQRMDITAPMDATQPAMFYTAGAVACDVAAEQGFPDGHRQWERTYVVALRMSDPLVYRSNAVTVVSSASPFTAVCTNVGNAPSDRMTIDIPGPFTGFDLYNDTTGDRLSVPSGVVTAGNFVRVDFYQRAILYNGTIDVTNIVSFPNSSWWGADRHALQEANPARGRTGANTIRMVPIGDASGAFTAIFSHAHTG